MRGRNLPEVCRQSQNPQLLAHGRDERPENCPHGERAAVTCGTGAQLQGPFDGQVWP